ncbi:UNVERIFIED_CONTAM: hypothetical protein Sradi_0745300 [Sesamum radiatum]|uniref:Uncharacterized protein n=1 Tax=Sesamum radiatum TaxID=300843 RepID=A0AAW2VPN7_SESRA
MDMHYKRARIQINHFQVVVLLDSLDDEEVSVKSPGLALKGTFQVYNVVELESNDAVLDYDNRHSPYWSDKAN